MKARPFLKASDERIDLHLPRLNTGSPVHTSWLVDAVERIAPYIQKTPLTYDPRANIFLKWENQQVTGSFKARGALNKILGLSETDRARKLVCASAGNHGQGVALAGRLVGAQVIVFAPDHGVPVKIQAMESLGAEVHLVPGGYAEAEAAAMEYSNSTGSVWVSPYNDERVIAGQATLAFEILDQNPQLLNCAWVVPVGGGGLVSGIALALRLAAQNNRSPFPGLRLIGVQSEASPFGYFLFHHRSQEEAVEHPGLADGLSGPIEKGSITIPILQSFLDDFILVSEQEIAAAIAYSWRQYSQRIEGSAAAALAAVLTRKVQDLPAVVILSGGNIQAEVHQSILDGSYRN